MHWHRFAGRLVLGHLRIAARAEAVPLVCGLVPVIWLAAVGRMQGTARRVAVDAVPAVAGDFGHMIIVAGMHVQNDRARA